MAEDLKIKHEGHVLFERGMARVCKISRFKPAFGANGKLKLDATCFEEQPLSYGVGIEVPCDDEGHWYVVSFARWDGKYARHEAYLDRVASFWKEHPEAADDFMAAVEFADDVVEKAGGGDEDE